MTEGKRVGFYIVAKNSDGGFDLISATTLGVVSTFDHESDAVARANLFSNRVRTESRSRRNQRGATRLY